MFERVSCPTVYFDSTNYITASHLKSQTKPASTCKGIQDTEFRFEVRFGHISPIVT